MGGGAMRTAAKVAALGGYRSAAVARGSSRSAPVASLPNAAGAAQSIPLLSVDNGHADAPVTSSIQRPSWEVDDWEFAGGNEEEILDSLRPVPRLVFGPVPTLEEAKDATADLKDAIEKVYFPPTAEVNMKMKGMQEVSPSASPAILPSVPKHVAQAFTLLRESPDAQEVVASIASDKNVWDAVMKNPKVMNFYKTHQTVIPCETLVDSANTVADELNTCRHAEGHTENPEKIVKETPESSVFMDVINAVKDNVIIPVKDKVSEMVANISSFFEGLFSPITENESSTSSKCSTSTSTSTGESYMDVAIGGAFVALGIAAILVVLLKRG